MCNACNPIIYYLINLNKKHSCRSETALARKQCKGNNEKRAGGGSALMTSRSNERSAIELPVPENIGVSVGISLLSCLEAEIQVLQVWRPPC